MSSGRRGLVLSVAFLGLVCWLAGGRPVHAQPPGGFRPGDPGTGRHSIWQSQLTPDQIRELLSRFGQDDGKNDWFEKMLFDAVKDKNPKVDDEQVKSAIKRLMADKEFMERMTDLAQKQKNQMPNNPNGGKGPQFTRDDLEKLGKLWREGHGGDPFKVPERPFDPNALPPFDPKNPNFDPEKFPAIDPKNPPQFDPKTKFPLDPETGRPFDPTTGKPINPNNPPKFDPPPPPKVNPDDPPKIDGPPKVAPENPNPPKFDPKLERPGVPPNEANGKRQFDPDNPLGIPPEPPEKVAKTKAVETATALWEKNVGPIDESPGVKRAIIDLVSDADAMEALTDGKGNNLFDILNGEGADGDKLGDLFGNGGGDWEWPKLDFEWGRGGRNLDWDLGGGGGGSRSRPEFSAPRSSPRSMPSFGGGPSFNFGGVSVPWVFVLMLLALVIAAVVWWKWAEIFQGRGAAVAFADGPGGWPIDPRAINTREDVVKAFEYLSVLICGAGAKTWTHSTIAEELTALAATHGETAVKLARLYELARYAPLDEPLTRADLLEARRLVCDLAGVDEA